MIAAPVVGAAISTSLKKTDFNTGDSVAPCV